MQVLSAILAQSLSRRAGPGPNATESERDFAALECQKGSRF